MIDYRKVFIDTAPFIYFIEKDENNPRYFDKMKNFFIDSSDKGIQLVTSVITVEEYMVYPYRNNLPIYVETFEQLIHALDVDVLEISMPVARKAAKIRADYQHFKAMDALQLAAASMSDCDLFLTNDRQLRQYRELKCLTIEDLE
ncbi:MAG: PIN domain-containing protein [Lachnospiraceae bacterium]|nr:PIN domain-containing protein [Lachnospiraceae bacterium]